VTTTVSGVAASSVRSFLEAGERLLWEGQPDVSRFSLRGAWFLVPFSFLWGGFALFWEASAFAGHAPLFFLLWGIPFVALGLYLIAGRIPVARREARRTRYGITDQRVLLLTGAFGQRLTAMQLKDLPPAQLDVDRSGYGSITFGIPVSPFRVPPGWPTMGMWSQPPAFTSIADARRVYEVLNEAKAAARSN
jgi:hypothetical protein